MWLLAINGSLVYYLILTKVSDFISILGDGSMNSKKWIKFFLILSALYLGLSIYILMSK